MAHRSTTSWDMSDTVETPRYALTNFSVDEVEVFWPHIEAMLDRLPHTWKYWTKEHIYNSVMESRLQVWGIGSPPKATFILFTSVDAFPAMKVLTVIWAAGTYEDEMLPLLDATFTDYARLQGCDEIEIRGRIGWDAKFRSIGFRRESVVLTRSVRPLTVN